MKNLNFINIFGFILINIFFSNSYSQINNTIVVKVGESLITSLDIKNEIVTNLIINKLEITQVNINNNKNYAIKNLINKSIKRNEINKYQITNYNKKDLYNYIENVAKNLNTNSNSLNKVFKEYNINYKAFLRNHETELLWNTLIFQLYKNQTNVNILEVENEVKKISKNQSEDELKKIKENILNKKKEEKLNLFSRSHFSNLENTVSITFQ
jgi:hypothetical protein